MWKCSTALAFMFTCVSVGAGKSTRTDIFFCAPSQTCCVQLCAGLTFGKFGEASTQIIIQLRGILGVFIGIGIPCFGDYSMDALMSASDSFKFKYWCMI